MTAKDSNTDYTPISSDNVYVIMTLSNKIILTKILLESGDNYVLEDPFEMTAIPDDTGTNLYFKPYMRYSDINAVVLSIPAIESMVIAGKDVSRVYRKYVKKSKEQAQETDNVSIPESNEKSNKFH